MMTSRDTCARRGSIALIGLRGSGKTTVGRELAALLGGLCVDTDDLVVRHSGKSIDAIFEEEGEDGFRRRERDAVTRIITDPPAVISLGGGAVLDEENVRALRRVATLVWLTAPVEVLRQRIASDETSSESRPALTGLSGPEEVERLLRERSAFYERAADLVIDTSGNMPRAIARAVLTEIDRVGPS